MTPSIQNKIKLYLIRHAQGYHNLPGGYHVLHDPDLTPLGISQCTKLSQEFPHTDKITHLVSSPLRRTIYTSLHTFPSLVHTPTSLSRTPNGLNKDTHSTPTTSDTNARKHTITLSPLFQENGPFPCDMPSPVSFLDNEFNTSPHHLTISLGHLTSPYPEKTGLYHHAMPTIRTRALAARKFLHDLGMEYLSQDGVNGKGEEGNEAHIAITTHGGFLHFLTDDFEGTDEGMKEGFATVGWRNCEWRVYEFVDEDEGTAESCNGAMNEVVTGSTTQSMNGNSNGTASKTNNSANGALSNGVKAKERQYNIIETDESRTRRHGEVMKPRLSKEQQEWVKKRACKAWSSNDERLEKVEAERKRVVGVMNGKKEGKVVREGQDMGINGAEKGVNGVDKGVAKL